MILITGFIILSLAVFLYYLSLFLEDENNAAQVLEENLLVMVLAFPAAALIVVFYHVFRVIYHVFEWTLLNILQLFTSKERS